MLRSIRSTALIGTLLFSGVAAAQPSTPAAEDSATESGKPGAPPAAPAPAPVAVPAPPPPAEPEAAQSTEAQQKKAKTVQGAGLSSQSLTFSGGDSSSAAVAETSSTEGKDWGFRFKGYFRGPMRIGIDNSGTTPSASGQLQFHAPPVTPDSNYTRWDFTGVSPGPWAELFFQYGNQRVMMTTSIASYNITSGGWRELQDQLGIDRAFLTLKFPEALGDRGGMAWDVGVFSNFYGALGKYDGGLYQTFIIGRTRLAGATATADMDLNDDVKLVLEGGFGAKMDQMYQMYGGNKIGVNDVAATQPRYDYPSWVPYPGQNVQQGTNLMAHIHAGLVINGILTGNLHYMNTFVRDARWNVASTGGTTTRPSDANVPGKASIQVMGIDFRLNGGYLGDGYIGYSYIKASHAGAISDSIEVLHSQGGWQLSQNFFQDLKNPNHIDDGTGNIHTVAGQYTFSFASFMMRPKPFWGQAADVTLTPFAMYNKVTGTSASNTLLSKLKYGVDAVYSFMPMVAFALRADVVNPNMSDSTESFYILSPRFVFRSEFVTHEMITLQYSRYIYGKAYTDSSRVEAVMPWPYGANGTYNIKYLGSHPDENVINLSASMWW
jgi:hypothetical protein